MRGFTLIELLIVMAIIAILTVLALPEYLGVEKQAKGEVCKQNLRSIAAAARVYQLKEAGTAPKGPTVPGLKDTGYFYELPQCPVDKSSTYSINWTTASVNVLINVYCANTSLTEHTDSKNYWP